MSSESTRLKDALLSYGEAVAPFDLAMRDYMMRTFAPYWRPGACLQVGSSHGDQTSLLLNIFDDVTVLEPVREFIDMTRAKVGDRAKFVEALLEDFHTDQRFETIVFSHVLEHVADPVAALGRLASLLSSTGRLFVMVPNAEAASRRIAVKMGVLRDIEDLSADDIAAGHRRVYRLDTLVRDIKSAGLRVETSGGIFFKPLANFQFNALMDGPLIGDAFMEGCFELGKEHPTFCASIFVIGEPA